jgi:enamine deaminase RidA (YjgF/YER057c/UK114 family)
VRENIRLSVSTQGERLTASTGSPWEPVVGYSRAVRVGPVIAVTGTVGVEADGTFPPSLEAQTRRSLSIIVAAIEALGGKATDVVRTRIFVSDISNWREIGAIHAEFFGSIRPATTMVQVARLIDDAALIEIEADAYLGA